MSWLSSGVEYNAIRLKSASASITEPLRKSGMAKKKKPVATATATSPEVYRKAVKPVRIRLSLAAAAQSRAEELAQDFTQYVNDALRMRLESEGRWPPPRKN